MKGDENLVQEVVLRFIFFLGIDIFYAHIDQKNHRNNSTCYDTEATDE